MSLIAPAFAVFVLAIPHAVGSDLAIPPGPAPLPRLNRQVTLPVGSWKVEYANEVTEVFNFQKDGTTAVVEPVRIGGKAVVNGGSIVMIFDNGRVQRWTPIGKRFVVEHWLPGSRFPTATPGTQGIAERTP